MFMFSNHWRSSIPFVVGGPLAHGQAFHLRIWSINWSDGFSQLPELVAAFYPMLSTEASEAPGKRFQGEPMVRLQASSQHPGSIWWVASRLWQDNYLLLVHRVFILPPNCRLGLCRLWLPMRCRKNGCVLSWDAYPGWPGGGLMLTYADYPLYFPCPKNIRNDGHTVRGQCHPSAPLLYIPQCQRTVGNLGNHPLVVPLMFCPMWMQQIPEHFVHQI